MKLIVFDENKGKIRINKTVEWILHTIGYGLILICMSVLFPKHFYISNEFFGLYGFIAAIIIYILNKTIKPIIVLFTLPITGLTMGLFYPCINLFILYLVSFLLGTKFIIHGIFVPFLIAIIISLMNVLVEELIIKPIIERGL